MKQLKNGHHDIKFVMNLQICKKKPNDSNI